MALSVADWSIFYLAAPVPLAYERLTFERLDTGLRAAGTRHRTLIRCLHEAPDTIKVQATDVFEGAGWLRARFGSRQTP